MCGIIGYAGHQLASTFLMKGLQRLEYRGYDSAGIALSDHNTLQVIKSKGYVNSLIPLVKNDAIPSHTGIGHTRWATHGKPSSENAHPHLSPSKRVAIVHNGIIENYLSLKLQLESYGYNFRTDTDSEIIAYLYEHLKQEHKKSNIETFTNTLKLLKGSYCVLLIDQDEPHKIYASKYQSPLIVGLSDEGNVMSSDTVALVGHTQQIIYIQDHEIVELTAQAIHISSMKGETIPLNIVELNQEETSVHMGNFPHYMLKEIYEQPDCIMNALKDRVLLTQQNIVLKGMEQYKNTITHAKRIIILACGSSWHAGLVAEYWLEQLCQIPVEVEYASEFRYRHPIISKDDIVIAISQSGETADTIVALQMAKEFGAFLFGIVNIPESRIARITQAGIYTGAGLEIGVASTKAFTNQLFALFLFTLKLGQWKQTIDKTLFDTLMNETMMLPHKVKSTIQSCEKDIISLIDKLQHSNAFFFLGRGQQFPIALEGALKLKEIAYIHAQGYPAAEMKHGPIALIDNNLPVVIIAADDPLLEKTESTIQEIKSRSGQVITIRTQELTKTPKDDESCIYIPPIHHFLQPFLTNIPLQLLSYYMAADRGYNIDKPRNLAKSVTVE